SGRRRDDEPDRCAEAVHGHHRLHRAQGVPAGRGRRRVTSCGVAAMTPRPQDVPGKPLLVAAVQAESREADVAANVANAARTVRLAAGQGARLVVLPEAFLTGYSRAAFAGEVPRDDDLDAPWLAPLRDAASETECVVVVSTPLQRADARTLSLLVV